jgi:hypothetical protein
VTTQQTHSPVSDIASTVTHFKPSWCIFLWIHCLTGFILAHRSTTLSVPLGRWLKVLLGTGLWAVCLGGAATGLVFTFRAFPQSRRWHQARTPASLGWLAIGLLLMGAAVAPVIGWSFLDVYLIGVLITAVCAGLPERVRLGRNPLGSFAAQAAGHGALTLYAGYVLSQSPVLPWEPLKLYLIGFASLVLALRIILVPLDSRLLPVLYALFLVAAFACFGFAEAMIAGHWRLIMLVIPFLAWCAVALSRRRGEQAAAVGLVLMAWFLTDLAVILLALLR